MSYCVVYGCRNRTFKKTYNQTECEKTNRKFSFHPFPEDSESRKLWFQSINVIDHDIPEAGTVCSAHFDEADFIFTKTTQKLKKNAVPKRMHFNSMSNEFSLLSIKEPKFKNMTPNIKTETELEMTLPNIKTDAEMRITVSNIIAEMKITVPEIITESDLEIIAPNIEDTITEINESGNSDNVTDTLLEKQEVSILKRKNVHSTKAKRIAVFKNDPKIGEGKPKSPKEPSNKKPHKNSGNGKKRYHTEE